MGIETVIRSITAADNAAIAAIIRANLAAHGLDIPGTAYFDPELDHLSDFYGADPNRRAYFVVEDADGTVLGGVGIAEFGGLDSCAELQKLYLADAAKGKGLGKALMKTAEDVARSLGYARLYLETHTNLNVAVHLYERMGYRSIDRLPGTEHSTMNLFFLKDL